MSIYSSISHTDKSRLNIISCTNKNMNDVSGNYLILNTMSLESKFSGLGNLNPENYIENSKWFSLSQFFQVISKWNDYWHQICLGVRSEILKALYMILRSLKTLAQDLYTHLLICSFKCFKLFVKKAYNNLLLLVS